MLSDILVEQEYLTPPTFRFTTFVRAVALSGLGPNELFRCRFGPGNALTNARLKNFIAEWFDQ